ncbi:MAG TPA: hypothetical protein VK845_05265, partial [Gemmatimonadales bacterium]|nr:hypothetical protein [Gemmatimonadales bacterium]
MFLTNSPAVGYDVRGFSRCVATEHVEGLKMRICGALVLLGLFWPSPARAQTAADTAAIRAAVLDYVDGWWAGDVER